jgi:hypothetical protein
MVEVVDMDLNDDMMDTLAVPGDDKRESDSSGEEDQGG